MAQDEIEALAAVPPKTTASKGAEPPATAQASKLPIEKADPHMTPEALAGLNS